MPYDSSGLSRGNAATNASLCCTVIGRLSGSGHHFLARVLPDASVAAWMPAVIRAVAQGVEEPSRIGTWGGGGVQRMDDIMYLVWG